jgi:hypothetical protein
MNQCRGQLALELPETVQSVIHTPTNGALIAAVAQLWIHDDDQVLDVTYGRGGWWTDYHPRHLAWHDRSIDFRHQPEPDNWSDVTAYDPPYICPGGRRTTGIGDFYDRYGLFEVPETYDELLALIIDGLADCARVTRPGGHVLHKTQDYVSSGQLVLEHHDIVSAARDLGLTVADYFVHAHHPGAQPSGRRQEHSRRAHSFLFVFEKER